jgi:subtilisin family serine protease
MGIRTLPQHLAVTGALALALLLLALLSSAGPAHAHQEGEDFETGEVVVKLNPIVGATIEAINADYGTTTLEPLLGSAGIYLLKLPDGSDTEAVSDQMENDLRLVYAEPNFIAEVPEGGGRHRARGVSDESPSRQYVGSALNLSCAAEISLGKDTTVAVLDTGAQLHHPALKANFEGVARYDFVSDDTNPSDRPVGLDADGDGKADELRGHGTHVAGIVDRVAPEAKIMPLRVLDTEGFGNVFVIAEAISYAKRNGADAINLSFSTPGQSELLQDLIEGATENGVVVVAAAGNDDTAAPHYPAAGEGGEADRDGLLAVTSVDKHEKKSDFASYGPWVDVAAPGNGIRSAFPVNEYASWSGTSMATPFVAGQAALIREVKPSLDADDVEDLIRDTARSLDAKNPTYAGMLGAGHADIGASLERLRPGACS